MINLTGDYIFQQRLASKRNIFGVDTKNGSAAKRFLVIKIINFLMLILMFNMNKINFKMEEK
jgi:hypothetical protein